MMNDIFEKDLAGEMVSPNTPGYNDLINSIWDTMKLTAELNDGYHTPDNRSATYGRPIVIEDKVWIGINSTVLPDVRIGYGAIIGANSVVTKDVAPNTIVAGNPARFIKNIEIL